MVNTPSTGFVPPLTVLSSASPRPEQSTCPPSLSKSGGSAQNDCNNNNNRCDKCNCSQRVSRRTALRRGLLAAASVFLGTAPHEQPASAQEQGPSKTDESESRCQNCYGNGKIACELCSGTGFWRALSANDPGLKYKGVVCPECEGVGTLTCPVCLGTGEGNVRGLLRRRKVEPGPGRLLQTN